MARQCKNEGRCQQKDEEHRFILPPLIGCLGLTTPLSLSHAWRTDNRFGLLWLGGQDSNLDSQIQSLMAYRWPTPQFNDRRALGRATVHRDRSASAVREQGRSEARPDRYLASATTSISTAPSRGSLATWTVERAGGSS